MNHTDLAEATLEGYNHSLATAAESANFQVLIEDVFLGFCLTSICVLGILGNTVTLLVLCYQQRHKGKISINYFLIGLSICDTLFLFTWLNVGILYAHRVVGGELPAKQFPTASSAYFSLIIRPLGYIGQAGGTLFTVAVTVDRFLAVCHTFLAKRIWTQARALYITLTIFTVSAIFAMPIWFALEIESAPDGDGYVIVSNAFGESKGFVAYNLWLYTCVNTLIPLPVLLVLNIFIFRKVQEARKLQASMTRSQVSEISLARMLLCVVLVFWICNVPAISRAIIFAGSDSTDLIRLSDAGRVETYFPYTILRILDWLCIAFNSGANFAIYCLMSRLFRKSLLDLVRACLSQSKGLGQQETMSESLRTITGSRSRTNSQISLSN